MRTLSAQQPFTATSAVLMPNSVPSNSRPWFQSVRNDFIPHPDRFPLTYRRTGLWQRRASDVTEHANGDLGLRFRSSKHIAIGAEIEISIPLRGDIQKFRGRVVLVREMPDGYEIGLWLATEDDASRARIVEEICHLECYLDDKRRREERAPTPSRPDRPWPGQLPQPLAS